MFVKVDEMVDELGEKIARDMTREMGKPLREARGEAARAGAILRFFGGEGYRPVGELYQQSLTGGQISTLRRPLGVVGLITPWNFPAAIPIWKLSPALAYGNTVVLKLAWDAPLTGLLLAECFEEAGLPAGGLSGITGACSQGGNDVGRAPRGRAVSR